jgi:hypothetical protein
MECWNSGIMGAGVRRVSSQYSNIPMFQYSQGCAKENQP